MIDTQHTPGPWSAKGPHIEEKEYSFNLIATVQVSNVPAWEANARLIAAAPDLLAALEACLKAPNMYRPDYVWDDARAAIAKARGS